MIKDLSEKKQREAEQQEHKRGIRLSRFFVLVFVCIGFVVSFLIHTTLNIFVTGIMDEKYEGEAKQSVEEIFGKLQSLEETLFTVSSIMTRLKYDYAEEITSNVMAFTPRVSDFDHIVWVKRSKDGSFAFDDVYKNMTYGAERGQRYYFSSEVDLAAYLSKSSFADFAGFSIFYDIPFVVSNQRSLVSSGKGRPFVLSLPLNKGSMSGYLLAMTSSAAIVSKKWMYDHADISLLSLKPDLYSEPLYSLDKYNGEGIQKSAVGYSYAFDYAGQKWSINVGLQKGEETYFLGALPFATLVFGLLLTAFGALYIETQIRKSQEIENMNVALASKNIALRDEILERERLNNALQRSEKSHSAIIDAVNDIIFELDAQGMILFLNQAWERVTGFRPAQSQNLKIFQMLHPEDQHNHLDAFSQLISGRSKGYCLPGRVRTSGGGFRAVEIAMSFMAGSEDGGIRLVGTMTDVEERRRAEKALSETEKKYKTIVENAAGGIFQVTPEGVYLSANLSMARILGYGSTDRVLSDIKDAYSQVYVDSEAQRSFLRTLNERGSTKQHEVQVKKRNGDVVWVSENLHAVSDEDGHVLYYEGSLEDVTERRESHFCLQEAKLHSDLANRAKSEFLTNMSHELRTPLNSIIGFSEIVTQETYGPIQPNAYGEYIQNILESGQSLLQVINEILDISKIEAGERQLNESVVDVPKVVESCLLLLSNKIQSNEMTVVNNMSPEFPGIVAEELAVKQMIMNLLSNAIKFTDKGGRITLSSEKESSGDYRVSVTDTGVGFESADIEKALSAFGQVQTDLSRSNSGAGLGLTLVKALMSLHDGKIEIMSEPGIGTTVSLVFPSQRLRVKS